MYQKYEELRDKRGVTTAQVCKETGIGESTISNWKARGGALSVDNLAKLARFFGVTVDYFVSAT